MIFTRRKTRTLLLGLGFLILLFCGAGEVLAQQQFPQIQMPNISINGAPQEDKAKMSTYLQLMFFLTILTLTPYILVMSTAFIRIVITLSFLRTALGTQQVPPTQVLMGLALFLTMFVMAPVGIKMNKQAIQPYLSGDMESQTEFITKLLEPPQEFMLRQTRGSDIDLFLELSQIRKEAN